MGPAERAADRGDSTPCVPPMRDATSAVVIIQLYLAEATVKSHVTRTLAKLQLRDRVQLVVLAYECGLVRPG